MYMCVYNRTVREGIFANKGAVGDRGLEAIRDLSALTG